MTLAAALAAVVHAALILGIGLRLPAPAPGAGYTPLEVFIVTQPGPAPDQPDPRAVAAQQARAGETLVPLPEVESHPTDGLTDEPETSPEPPPSDTGLQRAEPLTAQIPPLPPAPAPPPAPDLVALDSPAQAPLTTARILDSRSAEIARLTSAITAGDLSYASRPRRRAVSTATREFKYATYMEGWRRKVERIGNLNYPQEAKRLGMYGQLILHVAVRADGSLEQVRVVRSSGHQVLDDAAKRIVELAAPYAPFPPDIRAETDVLDITRTWQFQRNNRLEWGN